MCCAHSGNKGRESGGRAAGSAAVEDVPAGRPGGGSRGRTGGAAGQGRGACDGEGGINFDSFSGG